MDERISIYSDPMDPDAGYRPFWYNGEPLSRVSWIERGVLANLSYSADYAKQTLHKSGPLLGPLSNALHMTGGESTIEEMIATTERGILVTRFSEVKVLDKSSLLSTANTRDGVWLVERGKISKAIRNFRFVDSPLFAFNSVEMLGKPMLTYTAHPLFGPITPRLVPSMRVRDFNFSATVDGV
jgi:predicted Zn-dependent protease